MKITEVITEAANPAQQAAIAIAKKKEQGVAEGFGEIKNIASEIKNIFTQLKNIPGFIEEYKKISANKELIKQIVSKILKSDRSTESIKKVLLGNNYSLNESTSFVEKVMSFTSSIILLISHYSLIALPLGLPTGNPGGFASLPKFTDRLDAVWPIMAGAMIVLALLNLIEEKNKEKRNRGIDEDWNKVNQKDRTSGMSRKAVKAYRRENPGSKLQTAVTTKPSKLKPGSKAAKRRKSFCARMSGNKGPMKKPNGKPTPKALALRRWNCESIEQMEELVMIAEQFIRNYKTKL